MGTEWLTTVQVAEVIGVSDDTVRRWIDAGLLRAREIERPGNQRTLRIRRDDLDTFLEERVHDTIERPPGPPAGRSR